MRARDDRRGAAIALVLALLLVLPLAGPFAAVGPGPEPGEPASGFVDSENHSRPSAASAEGPRSTEVARSTVDDGNPLDADSVGPGRDRQRVTLVTGETVTLERIDGRRPTVEDVRGGSVSVVEANDETYLVPDGVDLAAYDRSLFSVETLLAHRADGGGVPVLLDANASLSAANGSALRNVRYLRSADVYAAEVYPGANPGTLADLVADGDVHRVSIDRRFARFPETARPVAPVIEGRTVTGEGVTVAVLDTGIDATHPDFAGRVVDRVDFVDGDGRGGGASDEGDRPLDPHGHGTIVAGILAGSGSEDGAREGVAPGADLVDVRVMDERGVASASTIVAGIEYAVDADVDVILLSVGSAVDGGEAIADSVAWAADRGVVVVAAAGNGGKPRSIGAPGRPEGAITVGATDGRGGVAAYSSRGPTLDGHLKPDLVAPGGGLVGPRADGAGRNAVDDAGRYTRTSGTSVAAPQVAGTAALLLSAEPGLTAREIENRLASAARPVDGAGPFAQGSGEIDVDRALDPDVVARDAVIDFGLVEDDGAYERVVTFENRDDRRHDLAFETTVRNVDLGRDADGTASLNRTRLSLSPGERASIGLTIDGDTTSGAHAGTIRYSVAGEPRSVSFGFVRGGTVTVEKRPLTAGDRVDGDELWVLTEEGTHDELLAFENGTAEFVAGGGTYVLWSTGYDEGSGTTVFLSERRIVDGPTRVVLDEAATVPVGVDAGPIVARYGRLENRSVIVSMSTEYAGGLARRSVSRSGIDGRAVRVSRDPDLAVATTFLLTAGRVGSADLDVHDAFHLAHGVDGVRGPSVVEVVPDRLATTEYRYHRTTVDETYRARDRATFDGVWNQRSSRWFDLGGRTTQRIHRLPGAASYRRLLRGEGWTAHPASLEGTDEAVDVLAHPLLGLVEVAYAGDEGVTVSGTPFSDGTGTRLDPAGEHALTAIVDGEVVRTVRLSGGYGSLGDLALDPGDALIVRLEGNNSGGHLSTRTVTEVTLPAYAPPSTRSVVVEDRPPTVTDLSVLRGNEVNAVSPGEVTLAVDVDLVGVTVDPVVWFSTASPSDPPWVNETDWVRAETERERGRLLATAAVEDAGTISVAAEVRDIYGRGTRTMTVDAVHVGDAPDTTTATIVGGFVAADGTPAANDTVVVEPVGGGTVRYVSTDDRGRFEVEVPRTRSYDLVYVRGRPWAPRAPVEDDRPAWLPLGRVDAADDVDLGLRSLPPARRLAVDVTDERGRPVAGASVRLVQRAGNVSASEVLETTDRGLARSRGSETTGIDLAGDVHVRVVPPADERYPDQEHRHTVAADDAGSTDEPQTLRVVLETAPPTAALAAFGSFEPGDVVFLHARKSHVPAGAAEYRWDLDGDGEADRVTEKPTVRYVPDEETLQPTVTVVDEAGKTDESTLALPNELIRSGPSAG